MRRSAVLLVVCGCGRLGFDPVPDAAAFGAPQLVAELSGGDEEDPSLTADMLEIVFSRGNELFAARRGSVDATWNSPTVIAELETTLGETSPEISTDGLTLVFSSDRPGGPGNGDVYITSRGARADLWSAPQLVPELSSTAYDVDANATLDLTFLVMRSERPPGAVGNGELFASLRPTAQDLWGTPQAIAELNTASDDIAPFFHEASQTLYFASSRGGQGLDLWRATRPVPSAPFQPAVQLFELNTPGRESDPWVSGDGTVIYYSAGDGVTAGIFMASR